MAVRQTVDFRLAVPYAAWLFWLPFRLHVRRLRPASRAPWWAPPERVDPRAATTLGVLALLTVVVGYLGTLLTQTVTFAAEEFGADEGAQGLALASVRFDVFSSLVVVALADRRGRRRVLLGAVVVGCLLTATGALAPNLAWLAASQVAARGFVTAAGLIIAIVAAEEMPAGSRAYAVSLLALTAAFGVGLAVMALPVADLAPGAWRALFVVPLVALPLVVDAARRLPESRRFQAPHADAPVAGHGRRLALLAVSALLFSVFTAPVAQFQNEYLREERGFSAARISLFTIATNTPGGLGVVIGGRLADLRGRRRTGAVGLVAIAVANVAQYSSSGWPMWAWSLFGALVGGVTVPALGVYGPELFPTSLRGRANGIITAAGRLGSVVGLLTVGFLAEKLGRFGPAFALVAVGPLALVVLVLVAFPETAHRELEDLNPEDRTGAG